MAKLVDVLRESIPSQEKANQLMERLFATAHPSRVFGEPVTHGEYTVLTASEITASMGFGYGGGFGGEAPAGDEASMEVGVTDAGAGGGGGGGGVIGARPVAVIEVGPTGVRVEPVVDPTKIVLAFFTTFGAMVMLLARMRRRADELE